MDIRTSSSFPDDQGASPLRECDLKTAINVLHNVAKNLAILQRDSRRELSEIHKLLLDRLVADALSSALPTPHSHHELEMLILQRGFRREHIIQLLRKTTGNRIRSIEDLTEIEAMLVWHLLGGADE